MWFITTVHQKPKFYQSNGKIVNHDDVGIDWKTEHVFQKGNKKVEVGSSDPFIINAQQAISALYNAGVQGYPNKEKAKAFTKKLPHGSFKYLRITDKAYETESRRIAKELKR